MNGEDPYAAPRAPVSDPSNPVGPIRWKRLLAWGALICAAMASIYAFSGIVNTNLRFYGIAIEEIVVSIVSFVLYLVFLSRTPRRHFLQLMCVFLAVQIFGIALGSALGLLLMLAVDDPFHGPISSAELGRNLLGCLLAYVTWHATMRKQSRAQ